MVQDMEDRNSRVPRDSKGWDGKLRLNKDHEPVIIEGTSPSNSDADEIGNRVESVPGAEIDADEGKSPFQLLELQCKAYHYSPDLLENVEDNEADIDLNHSRVSSIPALRLERFNSVIRLCLRQNQITSSNFPTSWASASTLKDLDLYDNSIGHIRGLDELTELTCLDFSFNAIKSIRRIDHLTKLKDLFFVQNKISKIEGLEGLSELRNLELGGNRIRDIENLESLACLEELYLGKNKITELKNLNSLQNLKILSVQSNRLTSPSLSHLAHLPSLTDLYISHNLLDTLEPLAAATSLKVLDISSNPVRSLVGLEPLMILEELWASNCKLESFEEVGKVLGDKESLKTVYLEGNPLELRQRVLYRNKVKLALPQVKQVDATFVRET